MVIGGNQSADETFLLVFEMQVGAGGSPGGAHVTYQLSLRYRGVSCDGNRRHVPVTSPPIALVFHDHGIAEVTEWSSRNNL